MRGDMHSSLAAFNASNKLQPLQRKIFKRKTGARYWQKKKVALWWDWECDPDKERTAEELDDCFGLDDLKTALSNEVAINDPITNCMKNSHSSKMAEFLFKIEENVRSTVEFSDFAGLMGERKTVGQYKVPLSLVTTVEKIINVYGDITAASFMNVNVIETVYILFSATVKEMEDLNLDQVTEEKILKWRDTIKDALRINFKVEFAMNHLKKIARAYFCQVKLLRSIDEKLNTLYMERADIRNNFKEYLADAEHFNG